MSKPFTEEQNQWLADNLPNCSCYAELTTDFNQKFGTNYIWTRDGYNPIERRCKRIGLSKNKTDYGFTEEEDAWLREYAPRFSCKWLAENIVSVSGRKHSWKGIQVHTRNWLGIKKGNGGIREDTVQTCKKPIGSIASWGKQCRIKLQDTGDDKKDWYPYGRYVYEQHYGIKLPKEYQVIHLDGDKTNFEINNLYPVTHREHAILTANGWHSSGEITRTGAVWAKLSTLMKDIK